MTTWLTDGSDRLVSEHIRSSGWRSWGRTMARCRLQRGLPFERRSDSLTGQRRRGRPRLASSLGRGTLTLRRASSPGSCCSTGGSYHSAGGHCMDGVPGNRESGRGTRQYDNKVRPGSLRAASGWRRGLLKMLTVRRVAVHVLRGGPQPAGSCELPLTLPDARVYHRLSATGGGRPPVSTWPQLDNCSRKDLPGSIFRRRWGAFVRARPFVQKS